MQGALWAVGMKDKNGADLAVGDLVWFKDRLCTIRSIASEDLGRRTVVMCNIDDGAPDDPDIRTNGFGLAAVAEGRYVQKAAKEVKHRLTGKVLVPTSELARLREIETKYLLLSKTET